MSDGTPSVLLYYPNFLPKNFGGLKCALLMCDRVCVTAPGGATIGWYVGLSDDVEDIGPCEALADLDLLTYLSVANTNLNAIARITTGTRV
jgi:hypothetical protein